jgi:hypothetical protein
MTTLQFADLHDYEKCPHVCACGCLLPIIVYSNSATVAKEKVWFPVVVNC